MAIAFGDLQKYFSRVIGIILGAVFIIASGWSYKTDNLFISFGMGLLACTAVFMIVAECKENKYLSWFAKYTMPIFLMHTLFAASCRVMLMKLGITSAVLQVSVGGVISFVGPIAAMTILDKIKLDFLIYPGKLIKRGDIDACLHMR